MAAPKIHTATPVPVATDLRRAHRFVRSTREALVGVKAGPDSRLDLGRHPGRFRLLLSRTQSRRALLLLQSLVAEAERRGMEVRSVAGETRSQRGVGLGSQGHLTLLEIHEGTDRVALTEEEISHWQREHTYSWERDKEPPTSKPVGNGRLKVVLPERWDRRSSPGRGWQNSWSDGSRAPLDAKLDSVLRALQERSEADAELAKERARAAEARRREDALRAEREREQALERARAERLFSEASAWERAVTARRYIEALRARIDELPAEEGQRLSAWCSWADDYLTGGDPVQSTQLIQGRDVQSDPWPQAPASRWIPDR